MPTGTTKIILTGENARAVKAINEVATASEKAAAKSSSAFDKSTSKVGGAFQKLDRTLGSFGIPFTGALGVMGSKLEDTGKRSKGLKDNLSALGGGIALGAAAGFALIGGAAVKAALAGEKAHAQLVVAIKNAGQTEEQFGSKIDATSKHMADFGFQNDEVELSIATLTRVTKDTGKAIELQGLAADLAAARHISLADATNILVKVEAGRYTALGKVLGLSKEQVKSIHSEHDAIKLLSGTYGGAAAAAADTYAGKIAALQAKTENLVEELGNKLIPVIEDGVTAVLGTVDAFDSANEATDGWLGKIALAATAVPVAVFAIDKLAAGGKAIVGAYGKVGDAIGGAVTKIRGATVAHEELAVAADASGAAEREFTVATTEASGAAATAGVSIGVLAGALAIPAAGLGFFLKMKHDADESDKSVRKLAESLTHVGSEAADAQAKLGKVVGGAAAADLKDYSNELLANADAQTLLTTKSAALQHAIQDLPGTEAEHAAALRIATGEATIADHRFDDYARTTQSVSNAVQQATGALDDLKEKFGAAAVENATLSAAQKDYADKLASGTATEKELADARDAVTRASEQTAKTQDKVTTATQQGTDAAAAATAEDKARADAAKKLDESLQKLGETAGESAVNMVKASHLSAAAIDDITSAAKGMNDAAEKAFDGAGGAVDHFKDKAKVSFRDVQKFMLEQLGATESWAKGMKRLADLGLNQGFLRKLADAGPSSAGLVKSILDNVKTGSVKSLNALADGAGKETASLKGYLDRSVVNAGTAVARWNAALDKTRKEVVSRLRIEEQGYSDTIAKLRNLQNTVGLGQTAIVTFRAGASGDPSRRRAGGGPVTARNAYVVGEEGPELFVPSTSGQIVPNGATGTGRSVGNVTYLTINASGIGDRELGRQVVQALREYQRTRGPLNLKIAG